MANTYPRADQTAGQLIDPDYDHLVPNYNSLINKVYDWANRDLQALPVQIVKDSIRYAVDKAYRTLRIPPLEHTVTWANTPLDANGQGPLDRATAGASNIYQSTTALAVPADLIEFIHIRGRDDQGLTTRVFNEKSDIRSYWDLNNRHYNQTAFWSRQGNKVVLTPAFGRIGRGYYGGVGGPETQIEMYYYRRLPALNAKFTAGDMINTEVPNWFKDENEKIALYGALGECFAYLQEDDQAGKYIQLMMKEIEELNDEDRMRDSSGGNIQTQYTANGLI